MTSLCIKESPQTHQVQVPYICLQNTKVLITLLTDALEPIGTKPLASTVLTTQICFLQSFSGYWWFWLFFLPDYTILKGYWYIIKTLIPGISLTHCGLAMPYADINLGQHQSRQWLVTWWHQATTWTNVDLSSVKSCGIHLRAISHEMIKISTLDMSLKITNWKLLI